MRIKEAPQVLAYLCTRTGVRFGLLMVQSTIARVVSVTLSLLVMLAVMTYDKGFFVATVIGYGLGPSILKVLTGITLPMHKYVQLVHHSQRPSSDDHG